jgi:hypothetical protein
MGDRSGGIVGTRRFTRDAVEFQNLESSSFLKFLPGSETNIVTPDEETIDFLGDPINLLFEFRCPMSHAIRKKTPLCMVSGFDESELLAGLQDIVATIDVTSVI